MSKDLKKIIAEQSKQNKDLQKSLNDMSKELVKCLQHAKKAHLKKYKTKQNK